MPDTSTMTIRLDTATKDALGALAAQTRRSRSFLAAEAVADYIAREQSIIDGIEEGLAAMRAGDTIPHEQAMDELDALIDRIVAG